MTSGTRTNGQNTMVLSKCPKSAKSAGSGQNRGHGARLLSRCPEFSRWPSKHQKLLNKPAKTTEQKGQTQNYPPTGGIVCPLSICPKSPSPVRRARTSWCSGGTLHTPGYPAKATLGASHEDARADRNQSKTKQFTKLIKTKGTP